MLQRTEMQPFLPRLGERGAGIGLAGGRLVLLIRTQVIKDAREKKKEKSSVRVKQVLFND